MNNEENNNKPSAVDDAADIMSKYTDQPEDNPSDIDRDYEELTKEEKAEADYKKRLEELRKCDPFVYR